MKSFRPVLLKVFFFVLVLAAAYGFHRLGLFELILKHLDSMGPWAPAGFVTVYILTCVLFFPSAVFTFAAGALFGLWQGIFLSVLGTGLGSTAAFLIGRYLARDRVAGAFAKKEEFRRLEAAVKRKGWLIVLLARLSPVFPFMVGNYAFGLTAIPAIHYLFASMIGTVPSAAVYVYLGTLTGELALWNQAGRARTPAEWALLAAGLAATMGLAYYLRRLAQAALKDETSEASNQREG